MSLRKQLWFAIILILTLVFGVSFLVNTLSAKAYLEQQLGMKNADNASALALSLTQQGADEVLLELWLLLGLWLLDDWLDDELLDGWLLEEELLEEELLELELELGGVGGCGVVGLLALGQPVSARQAPTTRPSCVSCR